MEEKIVLDQTSFKALAADSRVKILKILGKRRHTQSELAADLNLSIPTVKEHLQALAKADLVIRKDEGRKWKYYELTSKGRGILDPEMKKIWILLSVIGLMVFAGLSGVMKQMFAPMYGFGTMGEAESFDTLSKQNAVDSYRTIPASAEAEIKTPEAINAKPDSGAVSNGEQEEVNVANLDSAGDFASEEGRAVENPLLEDDKQVKDLTQDAASSEYKLPRPDFSAFRFNTGVKVYLGILGVLAGFLLYFAAIRYRRMHK